MYALSPWIINHMMTKSPYKLPLILLLTSVALNYIIHYVVCPQILDPDAICYSTDTNPQLWFQTYSQMYTRAGPYFLGMIAAYWHLNPT